VKRAAADPKVLAAADRLAADARRAQRIRNRGDFAVPVKILAIEGAVVQLSPAGAVVVAEALRKAAELW